jgi:hypothetical protein
MTRAMSQMLYLQWKAARWVLFPFVLLAFALPLLAVQISVRSSMDQGSGVVGTWLVYALQLWMPAFPLVAAIVGFAAALSAWNWDHNVKHVYALSLPMTRARYAMLKMSAGIVSLLAPVAALLIGAVLATALVDMPEGLRAYPVQFTMRFLLAALLSYALGFALAAGTVRTTIIIVITLIVLLVFGTAAVGFIENVTRTQLFTPLDVLNELFINWAGPFHVYGGGWTLIDV